MQVQADVEVAGGYVEVLGEAKQAESNGFVKTEAEKAGSHSFVGAEEPERNIQEKSWR